MRDLCRKAERESATASERAMRNNREQGRWRGTLREYDRSLRRRRQWAAVF